MRARILLLFVAVVTTMLASRARADTPALSIDPIPPAASGYRLEILAADLAGAALFVTGVALEEPGGRDTPISDPMMITGAATFLFAAPTAHATHHKVKRAVASLGLRLAMPLLGALVARELTDCRNRDFLCGIDQTLGGILAGAATAAALDAKLLAGPETMEVTAPPALAVRPVAFYTRNMGSLGMAVRF